MAATAAGENAYFPAGTGASMLHYVHRGKGNAQHIGVRGGEPGQGLLHHGFRVVDQLLHLLFVIAPGTCLPTQSKCRSMMSWMNLGSRGECGVRGYTTIFTSAPWRFSAL